MLRRAWSGRAWGGLAIACGPAVDSESFSDGSGAGTDGSASVGRPSNPDAPSGTGDSAESGKGSDGSGGECELVLDDEPADVLVVTLANETEDAL